MSIKVVTHSGRFHTDEVAGVALLNFIYNISEIIRTRDEIILNEEKMNINTIVIDVGREYNPKMHNFDHHQESFDETFSEEYNIPMSSCGLIWKHYGKDIIASVSEDLSEELTEKVYKIMYTKVFLSIDGNDNGYKAIKNPNEIEYNYFYTVTLDEIVGSFNIGEDKDIQFGHAVSVCGEFFENKIKQVTNESISYMKNLSYFTQVFENDHKKRYLYLNRSDVYYGNYINKFDKEKKVLFFITKNTKNQYKIHTRKVRNKDYEIMAPIIPENDARKIVGDNLIFVHRDRFTGSCRTLEAAQKVVEESIQKHCSNASYHIEIELKVTPSLFSTIFFVATLSGLLWWIMNDPKN